MGLLILPKRSSSYNREICYLQALFRLNEYSWPLQNPILEGSQNATHYVLNGKNILGGKYLLFYYNDYPLIHAYLNNKL